MLGCDLNHGLIRSLLTKILRRYWQRYFGGNTSAIWWMADITVKSGGPPNMILLGISVGLAVWAICSLNLRSTITMYYCASNLWSNLIKLLILSGCWTVSIGLLLTSYNKWTPVGWTLGSHRVGPRESNHHVVRQEQLWCRLQQRP